MTTVRIVQDVLAADGTRLTTQGMMIDSADLARYQAYGWRLPLGAPAIPETTDIYDGFDKAPTDIYPWQFGWSEMLSSGETISTSQWIVVAGLTLSGQTISGTLTNVTVSGGTSGVVYLVTNRISTSLGHQYDWAFQVTVI